MFPFNPYSFNNQYFPYQNPFMLQYMNFPVPQQQLKYKILFWNILCDQYSYDWKTAPNIELKYKVWDYRKNLFTKFLSENVSDIYCFVEVDKPDDIFSIINTSTNNFQSIYYPRPNTPLGIMLVFNKQKFNFAHSDRYLLGTTINQNFALRVILQEKFTNNFFCVIITHLIAWEKNEEKRKMQVNNLMMWISNDNNLVKYNIKNIIICGDFNTGPESECIRIMNAYDYKSAFDYSGTNDYTIVIDTRDEGIKKLKFDYIFGNRGVKFFNQFMPKEYLDFQRGIPNENFPSDHLFLISEFSFNNNYYA